MARCEEEWSFRDEDLHAGLRCRVWGLRVQGLGFKLLLAIGIRACGAAGFRVYGSGFQVWGLYVGLKVPVSRFKAQVLGWAFDFSFDGRAVSVLYGVAGFAGFSD